MQAVHLDKSGLHHTCFPRNLRTAIFATFQSNCFSYLARPIFAYFYETTHLSYSICFSFLRRRLPFHAPSIFKLYLTFHVPDAYLEPSQMKSQI